MDSLPCGRAHGVPPPARLSHRQPGRPGHQRLLRLPSHRPFSRPLRRRSFHLHRRLRRASRGHVYLGHPGPHHGPQPVGLVGRRDHHPQWRCGHRSGAILLLSRLLAGAGLWSGGVFHPVSRPAVAAARPAHAGRRLALANQPAAVADPGGRPGASERRRLCLALPAEPERVLDHRRTRAGRCGHRAGAVPGRLPGAAALLPGLDATRAAPPAVRVHGPGPRRYLRRSADRRRRSVRVARAGGLGPGPAGLRATRRFVRRSPGQHPGRLRPMPELLRLYLRLIGARVRGQMQYRVSFGLSLLSTTLLTTIEFGAILILFGRVPTLAGWSLGEVTLLYGLADACFSLAELLGSALDDFQLRVAQGTFDRVLTRPRSAFFQVLAEDLALRRLGRVAQGLAALVLSSSTTHIVWTPEKLLVILLALGSGTAIFFSIFVLAAAFCFWTVEGKEATHI